MRWVIIALWVALIVALLWPWLRRLAAATAAAPSPASPTPARDVLVKDPVCQTYVVRSRAVTGPEGDEPPYFCSDECARRYAAGPDR